MKCCRYAFYSKKRGWKITHCALHELPTTRKQCLKCKEREAGDLDIIDVMNLPKDTSEVLLAQIFEFEQIRFIQHVTVEVPKPYGKAIKVLPLILSDEEADLLVELMKVCTIKKGNGGEAFLIYRGGERVYTPATDSFHFNSRDYKPTVLKVIKHQSYPPL